VNNHLGKIVDHARKTGLIAPKPILQNLIWNPFKKDEEITPSMYERIKEQIKNPFKRDEKVPESTYAKIVATAKEKGQFLLKEFFEPFPSL